MPKAKSLETGESLVVVRGCGSNVSCLCSTCGGVPSAAPCSLSVVCRCHSLLYSDTCSAAECMLLICTDVDLDLSFKPYKPTKHFKKKRFMCWIVCRKIQCEINMHASKHASKDRPVRPHKIMTVGDVKISSKVEIHNS